MEFVKKGKDWIRKGLSHDEKKELKQALKCYTTGIQFLMTAIKYLSKENFKVLNRSACIYAFPRKSSVENERLLKRKISDSCIETSKKFLSRAEEIKETLKKENIKENNNDKKEKKKKPLSTEQKKLRNSIEDAILKEKPNVKWEDVAGLKNCKKTLEEALILPQQFPQLFVGKRKPWKCVLLFGPPGTGKTFLAKAVATRISEDMTFFSVSSSSLVSKWLGESEKLVRNLFEMALEDSPSVVFIDEIDSIAGKRSNDEGNESSNRIKTELLIQIQKIIDSKKQVIVLAATNRPYDIDLAMRRRFSKRIYVPLPDFEARKSVLKIHAGKEFNISEQKFEELAKKIEGLSCADISISVRDALMEPIRQAMKCNYFTKKYENGNLKEIIPSSSSDSEAIKMNLLDISTDESKCLKLPSPNYEDLEAALSRTPPSVSKKDILNHEKFAEEFGMEG